MRIIILALVFIVLFCLPDLYISLALMRGAAWWAHLLLWLPSITVVLLLASNLHGIWQDKDLSRHRTVALPRLASAYLLDNQFVR